MPDDGLHAAPTVPTVSPRALLRATVIALGVAVVVTIVAVLPAEYGIDPTGIGSKLGLTQMGRLKLELAREAAADARSDSLAAEPARLESQAVPPSSR